jgi:hypothetical protein
MSDMTPEKAQALLDGATPGPWKVCETTIHGIKYGGCWIEGPDVDDGDGRPQGVLIPISGSGGARSYTTRLVDIQDHDHNDANAALIAAAPDPARTVIAQAAEITNLQARVADAEKLVVAAMDARETILHFVHARWSEAEGSDEDYVGELDAALSAFQEGGK